MAYTGYINKEVQAMYGIPYNQLTAEQKRILHADSVRRAKLIEEVQKQVMQNNKKAFEEEARMEKVLASIYKDTQNQIIADVTETMAKVKKAGGTWSYANQSALTRSRGLFEQITAELNKLGQKEQALFTQGLSNIYTDQFLRQVYELGQSIPVKANFNRLNPALIKRTLDYPWSGAMFSDRIWLDKEQLGKNLRVGLTQSMILGEGIPEITDRINKNINTSRYNAERLARTEVKRVTYVAHNDAYEDMGVEELEYRVANGGDVRVCKVCSGDNGKKFIRGKEPTLPRHPNCRCVYIPVVSDTFGDNELNELTGSIRGAENYEKWRKAEEEKLKKEALITPEQKKYNKVVDEIDAQYKAKQQELTALQAQHDTLDKEYTDLSPIRRGLITPEEGGFADKAEFTSKDNQLNKDILATRLKMADVQSAMADLEREKTYLKAVGVERVDTLEDYRIIRNSLKNNTTFDYSMYGDELVQMVARMDDDALIIHTKLSTIVEKNWYNSNNGADGAHYSPSLKRVNMMMSNNSHEKALGNGLKGSWQTKYHEEGHQLDHLLSKVSEFAEVADGVSSIDAMYIRAFTHTNTKLGTTISKAIEEDILSFLNTAIQYSNDNEGQSYKPLKSMNRISRDARYAFDRYVNYLTSSGADKKEMCQLGMFTDAIGLFTRDSLSRNTLSCGGWGHKSSYNKDRGKAGANSETWATFCALRTCGSKDEMDYAKKTMPETWKCLDGIYHQLAEYLKKNSLSY